MAATPMLYTQLEYKMAAVMQGKPYRVMQTEKGLDVPWGSEYVLEGRILSRKRQPEGPFGEFPGYYRRRIPMRTNIQPYSACCLLICQSWK